MSTTHAPGNYLLRLGDTCLVLSQRLTEWCGVAPEIEEDVAMSNMALDLLGAARLWLAEAGRREEPAQSEDRLAYWRDQHEFHNVLLVEQPNGNFADTQVRQLFFDAWHVQVLRALTHSTDTAIAGIAEKIAKEARYHLQRSSHWVVRLGDGTALSHDRTQAAVDSLWEFVDDLFDMDELDRAMLASGIGCDFDTLRKPWHDYVADVLAQATLCLPNDKPFQKGGRQGRHGEHLGRLLETMQGLARSHPGATW